MRASPLEVREALCPHSSSRAHMGQAQCCAVRHTPTSQAKGAHSRAGIAAGRRGT